MDNDGPQQPPARTVKTMFMTPEIRLLFFFISRSWLLVCLCVFGRIVFARLPEGARVGLWLFVWHGTPGLRPSRHYSVVLDTTSQARGNPTMPGRSDLDPGLPPPGSPSGSNVEEALRGREEAHSGAHCIPMDGIHHASVSMGGRSGVSLSSWRRPICR